MGALRRPGTGLSAKRAAAWGDGKGHGGGSLTNRLGAICRAMRRGPRNAQLRHAGADEDRHRALGSRSRKMLLSNGRVMMRGGHAPNECRAIATGYDI